MQITTEEFRLKNSSLRSISAPTYTVQRVWQKTKPPCVHYYLPPSDRNNASRQRCVHVDTVRKYYASERNATICVELDRPQSQAQQYTKCDDNAILAQLSANFGAEVILRNGFGETSSRFVILNGDETCYLRQKGNPKIVLVDARLIAQPSCSQISRTAPSYNTLC